MMLFRVHAGDINPHARPGRSSTSRSLSVAPAQFALHEQVEALHLVSRPRRLAQKLQARCDARVAGKAAQWNALAQVIPAIVRHQRRDYGLQRQAVQRIANLGRGRDRILHDLILAPASVTGATRLEYSPRKRGRVVDCTGLENRRRETVREFESHRFRQHRWLSSGKAPSDINARRTGKVQDVISAKNH